MRDVRGRADPRMMRRRRRACARAGDDPGTGAWIFSDRLRWAFLAMGLRVPAGRGVVAARVATTPSQYLVVFAAAGQWPLHLARARQHLAGRPPRSPAPDDRCWWLWLAALGLMYAIGCAMVIGAATDYATPTALNAASCRSSLSC